MKALIQLTTLAALSCLLCVNGAARSQYHNPKGCLDEGYSFHQAIVQLEPAKNSNIYLFANTSNKNIALQMLPKKDDPFHVKMENLIVAHRWSSLATMDVKTLKLRCHQVLRHDKAEPIDCARVLHICQYKRAKFGEHNHGTYWVVENKWRQQIIHDTIRKGILLR